MGSSKALVSNLIFHLHKSSTHLLQNHRMVGNWRNFWSFISPTRSSWLPAEHLSSLGHLSLRSGTLQEAVRLKPPKGSRGCECELLLPLQRALCTFSSWSDAHCYVTLCSSVTGENLWEGSSPSPRHRSMHSSWPTSRTTPPPCVLCLCLQKGSYPSTALLLNPWCLQQHPHDLDKITACNCTQSSNLSILPQGVYLCTGGLEWQSVVLQNRLLKASHKESQRMRTTHIKHQTSKAIQRTEQIRGRKTWGHPRRQCLKPRICRYLKVCAEKEAPLAQHIPF